MLKFTDVLNGNTPNTVISESVEERFGTEFIKQELDMLYKRYAEEILAWYTYFIVKKFMQGTERTSIESKIDQFANDELHDHAEKLLDRISQLGGSIDTINALDKLNGLSECTYSIPFNPYSTDDIIRKNIEHEKCAIKGYEALCELTREKDDVTYHLACEILKDEEEHLDELNNFAKDMNLDVIDNISDLPIDSSPNVASSTIFPDLVDHKYDAFDIGAFDKIN